MSDPTRVEDVTIAILAGGQSSRLGQDKALVEVGGVPMLRRVLDRVIQLKAGSIQIITNQPAAYYAETLAGADVTNVTFKPDRRSERSSMVGLTTALLTSSAYTLVLACDMPFVHVGLLEHMLTRAKNRFAVMPRVDGQPQPFHALYYGRVWMPRLHTAVNLGQHKITTMIAEMPNIHYLDEPDWMPFDGAGHSFWNINTPDDLTRAQRLAEEFPDL